MLEVIAVRYQGNVSMLKLADGTVVTKQFFLRQLLAGREAFTRPLPPAEGARIYLVQVGVFEFLSIDPVGTTKDDLGPLPTF
ncbi:MAG: hypothetical protein QM723_08610 [Myxococcaceae bacterium]